MHLQHGKSCRDCSAAEHWPCITRFELEQQRNRREPDSGAADFYPSYLGDWVRRVETAAWATEGCPGHEGKERRRGWMWLLRPLISALG